MTGNAILMTGLFFSLIFSPAALLQAEGYSDVRGKKVLNTAYRMAFVEKKVFSGSCYDFINAAYNQAGFTAKLRKTVFSGSRKGPYADINLFRPGDWVMHINLEFHSVEHSVIFVRWKDKARKIAVTLDYAGMKRREPGKYRDHDLSKVFRLIRPR